MTSDSDPDEAPIPWRELPPGLQLDAVIAFHDGYLVTGASNGVLWGLRPGHPDMPLVLPKYSTDTDAALWLFERLPGNCTPRLSRVSGVVGLTGNPVIWLAEIFLDGQGFPNYSYKAHNVKPAMAICHVVLSYKEAQEVQP